MTDGISGIAGPIFGIIGMGIGLGLILGTVKAIQKSDYGRRVQYPFIPLQPQRGYQYRPQTRQLQHHRQNYWRV